MRRQHTEVISKQGPVNSNGSKTRIDWVDFAKGFCIIMVVIMHATLAVEEAFEREGFMQYVVAFAKPFRMPDFFLISGLFLARVIKRTWQSYLDSKVIHFFYFYVLWVIIHIALVSGHGTAAAYAFLNAFVQPLGTLWFIYLLPVFFMLTKLALRVHPAIIFCIAAVLQICHIETGWLVIDQTAERFVYFFTGYWLAPHIFRLVAAVLVRPLFAWTAILAWAVINGFFVSRGYAALPFISLPLGLTGAAAVVTIGALLSRLAAAAPIRYCGRHSIVIYLAFFLPMHATIFLLLRTSLIANVGFIALIVTAASVSGALIIWRMVRGTRLSFLFVRPAIFRLDKPHPPVLFPAPPEVIVTATTHEAEPVKPMLP